MSTFCEEQRCYNKRHFTFAEFRNEMIYFSCHCCFLQRITWDKPHSDNLSHFRGYIDHLHIEHASLWHCRSGKVSWSKWVNEGFYSEVCEIQRSARGRFYCRLVLEFELIPWAFGKFPIVVTLWLSMSMSTVLIVYPLFNYWANNRRPGPACKCVVLPISSSE